MYCTGLTVPSPLLRHCMFSVKKKFLKSKGSIPHLRRVGGRLLSATFCTPFITDRYYGQYYIYCLHFPGPFFQVPILGWNDLCVIVIFILILLMHPIQEFMKSLGCVSRRRIFTFVIKSMLYNPAWTLNLLLFCFTI